MVDRILDDGGAASGAPTAKHPQPVHGADDDRSGVAGAQQSAPLPTGERVDIALEAAWELEELARGMLEAMRDCEPAGLRYRPQAVRVLHLSQLLMGALGDDVEKTPNLWAVLTGLSSVPRA